MMQKKMSRWAVGCLLGVGVTSALAVPPSIGGSVPSDSLTTVFSGGAGVGAWELTVHSYAFIGTDAGSEGPGLDVPDPVSNADDIIPGIGQTLFVYYLDMTGGSVSPASVDQFVVGNPEPLDTQAVGFSNLVLPVGEDGSLETPSAFFSSQAALSVVYEFAGANTLDAAGNGEFAVVYVLFDALPGFVHGSVQGGFATTDVETVLGPAIPEPVTLGLMLMGGLFVIRRRGLVSKNVVAAIAVAGFLGVASSANAADFTTGVPTHSEVDFFAAGGWSAKVTSFVYQENDSSIVPSNGLLPTPGPNQTLFVYIVENIGAVDAPSITSWTVANSNPPVGILNSLNTDPTIPVTGLVGAGPAQQSFSQTINPLSEVFTWANLANFTPNPPGPPILGSELDPGSYSVEFYVADAPEWQLVNGTVQSSALPNSQDVPGPAIPEPASLGLLLIGGLFAARRRK